MEYIREILKNHDATVDKTVRIQGYPSSLINAFINREDIDYEGEQPEVRVYTKIGELIGKTEIFEIDLGSTENESDSISFNKPYEWIYFEYVANGATDGLINISIVRDRV